MNALSMPGNIEKIKPLFESNLLGIANCLLYSELSYFYKGTEEFDLIDAITNAKRTDECEADYIFCDELNEFLFNKAKIGTSKDPEYVVGDDELKRIIAILRLAVPYTGLILTAREDADVRRECMALGVSQIDAGTQIELQGYSQKNKEQDLKKEQFKIGDSRSLDEVLRELVESGFTPSFCTACYRLGRTGEHFMEFSKPGFIHHFCTPNALVTLAEYLEDYASQETKDSGYKLIFEQLEKVEMKEDTKLTLKDKLIEIKQGKRDLYY